MHISASVRILNSHWTSERPECERRRLNAALRGDGVHLLCSTNKDAISGRCLLSSVICVYVREPELMREPELERERKTHKSCSGTANAWMMRVDPKSIMCVTEHALSNYVLIWLAARWCNSFFFCLQQRYSWSTVSACVCPTSSLSCSQTGGPRYKPSLFVFGRVARGRL